jgi:hypothetical protein
MYTEVYALGKRAMAGFHDNGARGYKAGFAHGFESEDNTRNIPPGKWKRHMACQFELVSKWHILAQRSFRYKHTSKMRSG